MTSFPHSTVDRRWLLKLYSTRAAFSFVWVALMLALGRHSPQIGGVLLIVYPAWDALANWIDARKSGGRKASPTQTLNVVVSAVATVGIAVALAAGPNAVLRVFGAWALLAGVLQLATGVRRWRTQGAQWAMVLSGAQSTIAGALFIMKAGGPAPMVDDIARYATVGAVYFLISALVLLHRSRRRAPVTSPQ